MVLLWVQDTAASIGSTLIVQQELQDKTQQYFESLDLSENIEEFLRLEKEIYLGDYGTIKLGNILAQFELNQLLRLKKFLQNYPPTNKINDQIWISGIHFALDLEEHEPFQKPGHWWILNIANRMPGKIIDLIKMTIKKLT